MIILGIDPGTATTGYGVVKVKNRKRRITKSNLQHIDNGCIKTTPDFSDADRLKIINSELNKIIKNFQPDILAVESVFFFKNFKTAFTVSQAKGVIMFTAAKKKIPIYEFTPLQVKMTIVGYGRADKKQVQNAVQDLFNLKEIPKPDDAADALAIAACYAYKML